MKTQFFGTLFLLGVAPIALTQTSAPSTSSPDRTAAVGVQVVLPVPNDPGTASEISVEVTYISSAMAHHPGAVSILGRNLHLVQEVRVAGLPVPITFNNGTRLVITPGDQIPGFNNLELIPFGDDKLDAKMEFTPCMSAEWRNGRVRLQLHPGAQGWYLIQYSYRALTFPDVQPGIYYANMLDLTVNCGTLCSGLTPDDGVLTFPWMRVPPWAGPYVVGPMHVQALCLVGDDPCFSNMVTLAPHM